MTDIPMGLRAASYLFTRSYFTGLRAQMSIEQVLLLHAVRSAEPEPVTILGLGRSLFTDRSTISTMVRTLIRWKYLYEIEHDGDARQKRIGITGMGKSALTNHLKRIEKAEALFMRDLSDDEEDRLRGLLMKISNLAAEMPR